MGRGISSEKKETDSVKALLANDLWIGATENGQRINEAGVADRVFPVHAEAHALPYAEKFFDALVSLDAYHYFGTDDLYIGYYSRFVKPGGQIGIIVPGLKQELAGPLPEHLAVYWPWDFCSFHSPEWWRRHWEKTGMAEVLHADMLPDGWKQWLLWQEVCLAEGFSAHSEEADLLRRDAGRNLGFTRVVARKPAPDLAFERKRDIPVV
jgi:SAM-dependent methyltransferase